MTAPLKPCPQGCPASFAALEKTEAFQRVKCDCGWTGPKRKNSVRAIAAWNTRADAPELVALVGLMSEVIASLDATGCNVSLVRDLRAALAAYEEMGK